MAGNLIYKTHVHLLTSGASQDCTLLTLKKTCAEPKIWAQPVFMDEKNLCKNMPRINVHSHSVQDDLHEASR